MPFIRTFIRANSGTSALMVPSRDVLLIEYAPINCCNKQQQTNSLFDSIDLSRSSLLFIQDLIYFIQVVKDDAQERAHEARVGIEFCLVTGQLHCNLIIGLQHTPSYYRFEQWSRASRVCATRNFVHEIKYFTRRQDKPIGWNVYTMFCIIFIFVNMCSHTMAASKSFSSVASGIWNDCRIICRLSKLFLFLEELSNIIYSCLLTLTVVQNLVWSNQLNVSHFVIQCQLLPSHSP